MPVSHPLACYKRQNALYQRLKLATFRHKKAEMFCRMK